jgi:hypothetical protein
MAVGLEGEHGTCPQPEIELCRAALAPHRWKPEKLHERLTTPEHHVSTDHSVANCHWQPCCRRQTLDQHLIKRHSHASQWQRVLGRRARPRATASHFAR